ncbi:HAD family hydrolase [Saccharopolyspora sp. NPDC002376]
MTDTMLILFDWNGTVMDDALRARDATNELLRRRDLPQLSTGEFRDVFRLPMAEFLRDLGIAPNDSPRAEAEWNAYLAATRAETRPGAADVFASLRARGARLGIISAASTESVFADAVAAALDPYLDFVSGDVGDKTQWLRHNRGDGTNVYVGDTEYDVNCAKAAGFTAVAIAGGYCSIDALRAAQPDIIVESLPQLLDAVFPAPAQAHRDRD